MGKKVIFLDIDGTLTEPGSNEPPESALMAIKKAQTKGNYVILCTGRNYDMLSPLLKYGFDGVIGSSGGYVEFQGKVIYDCPMTEEQKTRAMKILEEHGIYRTVECKEGSFTDEGFKKFLKENASREGNSELLRWREQIEKSLNILPMKEYQGQPVYKLVIMCENPEQLEEPKKALAEDFNFCIQEQDQYGIVNGEIVNKKFDKGQAVERMCRYLQIPLEDSVAYGDSMNDLEMMQTAGFSVCMANGSDTLKKEADEICPAVLENGLYQSFEKHGYF